MLTHLHITDFTLVDQLDLELHSGLSTITGETGAGKSIMLGALGLALGDRAEADKVRVGKKKAEIHASFDISQLSFAKKWLLEHELAAGDECILRRIIATDGRSRSYINGQTVTLSQLRTLGDMLIDIHSQHEHQSLLNTKTHQRLLDAFGGLQPLSKQVKESYREWRDLNNTLMEMQSQNDELNARFQLLHYQVQELDQLGLEPGELQQLEAEQNHLANAETIDTHCRHVVSLCSDDEGLQDRINQAVALLQKLDSTPTGVSEAESLLRNALIHVQEAQSELDRYLDGQDADPARLPEVEARLSAIYDIARKHRVTPEALEELHNNLSQELAGLQSGDEQIEALEQQRANIEKIYRQLANELSEQRQFAAARLAKAVNDKLAQLAMSNANLSIALNSASDTQLHEPSINGNEMVEFLISTNPGQAAKPLVKVASGGELSRVSLAIQVVTAQTSTTPTLIFDEVDVGIGGATGDEVGKLLRELGQSAQIFCVTHLAQVASKAHHHLLVSKQSNEKETLSRVAELSDKEKIAEIARMMGGPADSQKSLAHAKEMMRQGAGA
ncbi:DNA repair protein RecN [Teredinibacter waterburyi]|uniref:DNA repair protein RecN n=1 Tax=Teredinibacter waterburyi TaxID=1500538 RepID=UPI00165F7939|nr:DNA repair protein RecN [Teredinibacter waterburyi]